MSIKKLPFTNEKINAMVQEFGTPFHMYDEKAIRNNARLLKKAFAWAPEFKEYFAVKALPNPYIVQILREEGCGADCSSLAELYISKAAGLSGKDVYFTSNDTPLKEYSVAMDMGAVINLDDITHVKFLNDGLSLPDTICFRYNPGPLRKGGNEIIGYPEEAKYGMTATQLLEAIAMCRDYGVRHFGIHTMIVSNELNIDYFCETADMMFKLAVKIKKIMGIDIEFVNLGGGIGIPYRPEENAVDLVALGAKVHHSYDNILVPAGLDKVAIYMESGRMMTGPYGYLVATAIHKKETYKNYIGLDACMSDLMRPGIYGAYHHITVVGKEDMPKDMVYDVTGSLCENNDKFAVNRSLPVIDRGDIIVIHDTGAHGHAMGFNYNGKLRPKELLVHEDGSVKLIRRAETLSDYFATLDYPGLEK